MGAPPGKIILTADNSLMSDYRHNEFLGFGTCAPPNVIPDLVFRWLFFPPVKAENGKPTAVPYGLRKVEAQLLNEGFDVSAVAPSDLNRCLQGVKVLGIHVMDPFGLGPASSTLAFIFKKEPFLAQYFHSLLDLPEVRKAKNRGLRIIVGGPGTWQFLHRKSFVENHGIDCIVSGEAERVIGKVMGAAIKDEPLPLHYEVGVDETPKLEEIPDIKAASVNGLVEIGRGCCRGCQFCSVTLRPLRWCPFEKIFREMEVNFRTGMKGTILHAEDVMLYGSKNTVPDDEKLLRLHEMVVEKSAGVTWSHCSLAAVAAKPKLFSRVAELIRQKQTWWGVEIGLETGSVELAKKIMPAKALPFKVEEWREVACTGMGLMHDNMLIPAATLVVGSPEETEEDLVKTIELLDDLKDVRSLIVPLFFVPMGKLKNEQWFKDTQMTTLHQDLLVKCLEHDLHWVNNLIDLSFSGRWQMNAIRPLYKLFVSVVKMKIRQAGIQLKS